MSIISKRHFNFQWIITIQAVSTSFMFLLILDVGYELIFEGYSTPLIYFFESQTIITDMQINRLTVENCKSAKNDISNSNVAAIIHAAE